jgi:hypothetical protein
MSVDHYLQAAFMGLWGTVCDRRLRYRPICVRMKQSAMPFRTVPDAVCKKKNLYPGWLEKTWPSYEDDLPRVAAALEGGHIADGDESFLLLHIAALKARSPFFLDYLNDHQRRHGLPLTDATTLPSERILSLLATVPYAQT